MPWQNALHFSMVLSQEKVGAFVRKSGAWSINGIPFRMSYAFWITQWHAWLGARSPGFSSNVLDMQSAIFELKHACQSPGVLIRCRIWLSSLGWGLRFYNSHRLPGGATAASRCITLEKQDPRAPLLIIRPSLHLIFQLFCFFSFLLKTY